ncbi:hypothetical protein BDP81DRAFT_36758 [Colletotrichum phormii]|uniref:Uncharacterized protein n=1 Tax=Colletotrichum phormii TaxID=359342 RepID=A0AAI9ZR53_9PEZI|nr:uncharacterized protein BDP81DRAFT_36758 [Colletotrichum phormii]KAK1636336.1 hypothetical protein BDP81DRAFT_36758 [Colletotrichum phormii]
MWDGCVAFLQKARKTAPGMPCWLGHVWWASFGGIDCEAMTFSIFPSIIRRVLGAACNACHLISSYFVKAVQPRSATNVAGRLPQCHTNTASHATSIGAAFDSTYAGALGCSCFTLSVRRNGGRLAGESIGDVRVASAAPATPKRNVINPLSTILPNNQLLVVEMPRACMGSLNFGCCRVIRW